MANTTNEILLTLGARNNASSVFGQVDRDAKNMASSISSAVSSINQGLMNISSVTDNMMQGLTGKSALDNILGTTSKNETNMVLLGNMLDDSEKNFDSFYKKVDETTDNSIVSMQEMIPALKAFKSATGAADKDVESVTDEIANFGAAVLAQTGSADLAQQSMMDLSKGIKGAFASLDQYGISQDALERTGYWNGDENDVKGFMKAVQKVTGSTDELMETNQGLDAKIGKAFSRAGKRMGNEFLPVIKDIKKGFLELDDSLGGNLTASILAVSGGVEVMNQGLWNVSTTVNGVRDLADGFKFLADKIKGVTEAAETASDAVNTMSNASDIGAGVASAGSIGGGATKNITGAENIALEGLGSWDAIDLITDSKKEQKATAEAEKQIGKLVDRKEKLLNNIVDTDDEQLIKKLKKGVASADSKLTTGDLDDGAIGALLQFNENTLDNLIHEDDGLSDAIDDAFTKKGQKISKAADKGGESLQKGLKKMIDMPSNLSASFNSFTGSFSQAIQDFKDGGIKGNFKKLDQKLLGIFKGTDNISDALNSVDNVADVGADLKGAKKIAEGVEGAASAGSAMAAAGPELEAAAAGGAAVEAGATGLAATFTSLMVPLLAVSAAIIIMIPIVAFIVAEAMIFIRLLADFMEALNFDSVNLDGAINGISQVATALAWVGVAMAAMSFASIMTGLAVITGGFLGITGPLDIAVNAIKEVGEKLSQFNTLSINPSVATNLQTIGDSLMAVSSAMGALTWTNITTGFSNFVAGALGFSSVTDGLEQAKQDIIDASSKLQEFSSMPVLDESVANNIQNVCDSLASVGDAMSALRSIRDGQNWDDMIGGFIGGIFGEGLNIQQALNDVKQDIVDASISLSQFTGLTEIPDGIGEKVKKVADTLKSVSEAFELLRGFRDDNIWDDMIGGLFGETDINSVLDQIIKDISAASSKLAGLKIGDEINDDLITSIKNVVSALTEVTNAANSLTALPPMEDFNTENMDSVMSNVQKAADGIKGLTIGEVNEDVITNIKNVASALTEISGVMTTLTTLPPMDGFDPTIISTAVTNVQTAATELSKLSGITVGEDVNGVLGSINTALQTLKDTLANASGFSEVSVNIGSQIVSGVQSGLSSLSSTVQSSVSSAISSASGSANSGGSSLGTQVNSGFQSTLNLHSIMDTEMGYVKTSVDNGIAAAKSAAESGAAEVVEAFKSGINVGSPGDIARTMEQEMLYTKGFILGSYGYLRKSAYDAGRVIVDSFGTPNLSLNYLSSNSSNLDALDTMNSSVSMGQNNSNVTIVVSEGAVNVDARNKTAREAKGIMTLALESMDHITNIDVDV